MSNLSDYSPPVRTLTLRRGPEVNEIVGYGSEIPPRTFGWLSDAYGALRREGLEYDRPRTDQAVRAAGDAFWDQQIEVWSDIHAR